MNIIGSVPEELIYIKDIPLKTGVMGKFAGYSFRGKVYDAEGKLIRKAKKKK